LDIAYIAKPAHHQMDVMPSTVTWIPPPVNFTNINVDDAVSKQSNKELLQLYVDMDWASFLEHRLLQYRAFLIPLR
jgi:hypothetical protein